MKSVWTLLESACAAPEVSRRTLLLGALSAVGLTACGQSAPRDSSERTSVVRLYKSPTCQCCSAWGEHLKQNGFEVEFHNETQINAFKASVGVPETLWSCHTEPPRDSRRLQHLREWSHDESIEVFTGDAGASGSDGAGALFRS